MKQLEIGSPMFFKKENKFVTYIAYWEERNRIVYAYDLFSLKRYDEIPYSIFEKEFITDKEEVRKYIQDKIEKEKEENMVTVPQKEFRKLEYLEQQIECMLKQNKPHEEIKRGERNIRRQNKKIKRYAERNQEIREEIDYKYVGLWEQFGWYFGD